MKGRGRAAGKPRRAEPRAIAAAAWAPRPATAVIATRGAVYRDLAYRIAEAAVITTALWCALYTLRVLPGSTQRMSGAGSIILIGMAGGVFRARRWLLAILIAALVTVALVMFTSISDSISEWWVRNDRPLPAPVGAVVVLSAGLHPDTAISNEALDRLLTGLELLRDRRAPLLITTSTEEEFPGGMVTSRTDQARIIGLAGAEGSWIRVDGGNTTHDEAVSMWAMLQPRGARRIALVTSPMHTRRACAVFERAGFTVTCVAARVRGAGALPLSAVPEDRFSIFGDWVYEMAALLKYRQKGWLPS